jgi:hypothetical protein
VSRSHDIFILFIISDKERTKGVHIFFVYILQEIITNRREYINRCVGVKKVCVLIITDKVRTKLERDVGVVYLIINRQSEPVPVFFSITDKEKT